MIKNKFVLLAGIIFISIFGHTQENSSKLHFGLRGGINFQNLNGTNANDTKLKNGLLAGFNLGVIAEIPLVPEFYFQPSLLYTIKGAKTNEKILGETIKTTITISYIELPLNLLFKPMLGKGHFLLGFGPYIALGINGTVKYESNLISVSEDINFKNKVRTADPIDDFYLRPLDIGANIIAGYEFHNNISFQLNAQLGLMKINPEYEVSLDDKSSTKNTGFGSSLGYKF